jgi:cell volume regulation protein A
MPVSISLLLSAVIILICVICSRISSRLGVPMLLGFILLGMFFGTDGILKISFDNFEIAEQICSIALIFIMFYGGFGTKWSEARPVAGISILLSTLGVIITAGLTGLFCHFVLKISILESFLIGAVISSTDAASVFSVLRSKRLNLKYHTASILEVESGSNDPCSYMLTAILLSIMGGTATGGEIAYMIFAQLAYGMGFGILMALAAFWVLKRIPFASDGFDTVFVFAMVLLSYAAPTVIGGNGYLSAYIFGIILGNRPLPNKKTLVHFFDGMTGLMQMLVFFLLGLLSFPSKLPEVFLPALLIALFLTFFARPLAVFGLTIPFRCRWNQQVLLSFAGLRGAASIVFAIMAMVHPSYTKNDLFHMVFCIVLFSILFQGSLLPRLARRLHMIDASENVLKTFNDYTEEVPVQFIQFTISNQHPWDGRAVKELLLPPETLLVQLQREGGYLTPDGETVLSAGDTLILSAKAPEEERRDVSLTEIVLTAGHSWVGSRLSEISLEPGKLVIMIQRAGEVVIPNGKTVLQQGDVLVVNQQA